MEKKKKPRLRFQLFLPVLVILIIFPIAVFLMFGAAANGYFEQMAERNTDRLVIQMRRIIRETYGDDGTNDRNAEQANGKGRKKPSTDIQGNNGESRKTEKFLSGVEEMMRSGNNKTSVLVLGSGLGLSWPKEGELTEATSEMLALCQKEIDGNGIPVREPVKYKTSKKSYIVQLLESPAAGNMADKYVICYSAVPDTASLLGNVWKPLLFCTLVCMTGAGIGVWLITKNITKPLDILCQSAEQIGNGEYEMICDPFSTEELEELRISVNRMSKKLKASEENMRSFYQNVSHDLKTPLASITGYAQGIQYGLLKDPKAASEVIMKECLRMSDMVESILTLAKIENGSMKLELLAIPLDEFLEEQTVILRGSVGEKKLYLEGNVPEIEVKADAKLLIRVLQNAVSNCLRYAEHAVWISASCSGGMAEITVADDGSGIDEEELPHIFERFYKGRKGNFGLGLSIVQSGLACMGGNVSVENRKVPEHGAVYKLRIPISEDGSSYGDTRNV